MRNYSGLWTYWNTTRFDSVLNLEILEPTSFWFSFEHGNTGTPAILIQFWSKTDGWAGGRSGGRPGGRVGWLKHLRKNPVWEYVSWKNWILYISLNPDFLIFLQKRRAPKFHEEWSDFRGEISHMRPIQARKLKLLKWPFPGDFQMTAAATTSQELSHLAGRLDHHAQGPNIPFRESLTSTSVFELVQR